MFTISETDEFLVYYKIYKSGKALFLTINIFINMMTEINASACSHLADDRARAASFLNEVH